MKRWSCLLVDANVVIALFKHGIWDQFINACDVHLAETVIGEAHFYEDDLGARHDFDLAPYIAASRVKKVSVPAADVKAFVATFGADYIEKLDAGEAESLAYLEKATEEHTLCSADAIVFRVLGNLDRGHQGASLQEVLDKIGMTRRLSNQFTKATRDRWTAQGVAERLQGRGRRTKGSG